MSDSLTEEVISFTAKEIGVKPARISLRTRLLHDLGVDADDAEELLLAFSMRFDVDMSPFEFDKHFEPEPNLFTPFHWLSRLLPFTPKPPDLVPVTVGDLVKAAATKTWISK